MAGINIVGKDGEWTGSVSSFINNSPQAADADDGELAGAGGLAKFNEQPEEEESTPIVQQTAGESEWHYLYYIIFAKYWPVECIILTTIFQNNNQS